MKNKDNFFSKTLRRSADVLFATPLLDKYWSDRLKGKAVCLCYHRVDDTSELTHLEHLGLPVISPQRLRQDIRTLKKMGFRIMTFKDWHREGRLDPQRPSAILTFDDGYKDQYEKAAAVLESEGVRGVFFQSTGMIESIKLLWQHFVFELVRSGSGYDLLERLCRELVPEHLERARLRGETLAYYLIEELPHERALMILDEARKRLLIDAESPMAQRLYPTEEVIRQAHEKGHEIGCHGHLHLKRSCVTSDQFEEDLRMSVERVRACTGEAPISYAFPHGDYLAQDMAILSKFFVFAATVENGVITDGSISLKLPRFYRGRADHGSARRKRWLLTGVA